MNIIKEYRRICGITQGEMIEELKKVTQGIDVPLLSKMERGLCEPSIKVQDYLKTKLVEKNLEGLIANQTYIRSDLQDLLKRPVYEDVLREISKGSFDQPITKFYLKIATGLKDRDIRKIIADFRNVGVRIYSSSGSVGYWICQNDAQYSEMRSELISRAKSLFRIVAAMDNYNPDQMEMEL